MSYTKTNLRDVENSAPKFDMPDEMQARFARRDDRRRDARALSLFTLEPGFRIPFGHKHETQEEVYVVVRGSARVKVGDEIVELAQWDAIRFPRTRCGKWKRGPTASSTSRSAPATTRPRSRWLPAGGTE